MFLNNCKKKSNIITLFDQNLLYLMKIRKEVAK